MGGEDDIAAALPRPPLAAPARREAAIEEALRRFDGGGALPPVSAGTRHEAGSALWWTRTRRAYAGAFASIALVALIALPIALMSPGDQSSRDGGDPRAGAVDEATGPGPAIAAADADRSAPVPQRPPPRAGRTAARTPEARSATGDDPIVLAQAAPPPAPFQPAGRVAAAGGAADRAREARPADPAAASGSNLVVTGSRISRPEPAAPAPAAPRAEAADAAFAAAGAAETSAGSAGRGDWNACTVDDPGRSLAACRALVDPTAKGAAGRAAAHLADGLERAWRGDFRAAITAFDRAIEIAPRSAFAYLNRGLAWRRGGDLDRALADLDRAVRYAPRAARVHYQRSILLRQRGDIQRARADEERAVALDPRYESLVR